VGKNEKRNFYKTGELSTGIWLKIDVQKVDKKVVKGVNGRVDIICKTVLLSTRKFSKM
jgi:hypothetical protein